MERILGFLDFPFAVELIPFVALFLLPIKLCVSKNCAGVSGKTQILFALAYITKYMDYWLLYSRVGEYRGIVLRGGFVLTVLFTIYLIYGKFKDTNSRYEDSFKIGYLISLAAIMALIFNGSYASLYISSYDFREYAFNAINVVHISKAFSVFIDCVAILPQLLVIYQDKTNETRRFIFYYVYALGAYKALHLFNYIYKYSFYFREQEINDLAALTHVMILLVFTYVYLRRRKISRSSHLVDNQISLNI